MVRTMQTVEAEELAGGESTRLEAEGYFHFEVKDIFDGMMPDGKTAIKKGGLGVKLEVLHGEHKGKQVGITLQDPSPSDKDEGKFARVKQSAFLVAANVLTVEQCNGGDVAYDEQAARGHQVVAEVRFGKPDANNKKYLDLAYANIHHVDDPRVAKVEKDQSMVALIPSALRRSEEYFAPLIKKSGGPKPPTPPPTQLDTEGL